MEYLLSKEEMQAVINGDHGNVFAVLGIHRDKGSKEVFIRAYQPNTRSIEVLKNDGTSLGMMTKLDDRGFYQINLGVGEISPIVSKSKTTWAIPIWPKTPIVFSRISATSTPISLPKAPILTCIKNSVRIR